MPVTTMDPFISISLSIWVEYTPQPQMANVHRPCPALFPFPIKHIPSDTFNNFLGAPKSPKLLLNPLNLGASLKGIFKPQNNSKGYPSLICGGITPRTHHSQLADPATTQITGEQFTTKQQYKTKLSCLFASMLRGPSNSRDARFGILNYTSL